MINFLLKRATLLFVLFSGQFVFGQANDVCANAITLTPNSGCSVTYSTATTNTGSAPFCSGSTNPDDDVWFKFTATCAAQGIEVKALSPMFDPVIEVKMLSCNGNNIACENSNPQGGDEFAGLSNLSIGTTYFIRVYDAGTGFAGNFNICIDEWCNPPPCGAGNPEPANTMQICANVPNMCNSNSICGSTVGYGSGPTPYTVDTWPELTNAFCGSIENNSFFSFVASQSTVEIRVYGNCFSGPGIQVMIFTLDNPTPPGTCNNGSVTSYGCYSPIGLDPAPTNGVPITFSGMTPGEKYYVMVDGFAGANCDYQFVIGYGVQPSVSVSPDKDTVCVNSSLTLVASGGSSGNYSWDPDPALNTTSGDTVIATFNNAGDYSFVVHTAASAYNCPTTDTAFIHAQSPTQPNSLSDMTHCERDTFSLTTVPNGILDTDYEWSFVPPGSGGTIHFTPNAHQTNVSGFAIGDGVYTVIFSEINAGCGASSDSMELTIEPAPDLVVTDDTIICGGAVLVLNASGASSYEWDNGQSTSNSFTVFPISDTVHYVTGFLGNCSLDDSVVITVNAQFPVLLTHSDTICKGDTATISVSGANDFEWFHNQSANPTQNESPDSNTIYYVLGTTDGCSTLDSALVKVNALPLVVLDDFDPSTVCVDNGTIPLPNAMPSGGVYAGNGVGVGSFDPAAADTGVHTIYYGYVDTNGCPNVDSTIITVEEACLGLNTIELGAVQLYPNPVVNELTINFASSNWNLKILDVNGKEVLNQKMSATSTTLQVGNWARSVYHILITDEDGSVYQSKIILE